VKRVLVPLLLASACSASPPPPPPPPASRPAPSVAPAAAPRLPSLELTGTETKTVLTGRDPGGRKLYEVTLGEARAVLGTPDGGAFAVVNERGALCPRARARSSGSTVAPSQGTAPPTGRCSPWPPPGLARCGQWASAAG
jgi:hypothetical protein